MRIWGAVTVGVKLKHKNLVLVLNKISTAKGSPKLKLDGLALFMFTLTKAIFLFCHGNLTLISLFYTKFSSLKITKN